MTFRLTSYDARRRFLFPLVGNQQLRVLHLHEGIFTVIERHEGAHTLWPLSRRFSNTIERFRRLRCENRNPSNRGVICAQLVH